MKTKSTCIRLSITPLVVVSLIMLFSAALVAAEEIPFSPAQTISTGGGEYQDFAIGDLDGNSRNDIVVTRIDRIEWFPNDTMQPPTFSPQVLTMDGGYYGNNVRVLDLDGDTDDDVLAAYAGHSDTAADSGLFWYENDGMAAPGFATHVIDESPVQYMHLDIGMIDDNNSLDLVTFEKTPGLYVPDIITWWENTAPSTSAPDYTRHVVYGMGVPVALGLANIGENGSPVIYYAGNAIGGVGMEGDGSQRWFPHSFFRSSADSLFPTACIADDITGDLNGEIIIADFSGNLVWLNMETGVDCDCAIEVPIAAGLPSLSDLFAVDLDRDGDKDIVATSREGNALLWFDSNGAVGDPLFTVRVISFDEILQLEKVLVADMDGDTDLDLVVGGGNSSNWTIAWYENTSPLRMVNSSAVLMK